MGMLDRMRQAIGGAAQGERVRAVWNGAILAESDRTVVIEGNPKDGAAPIRGHVAFWKGVRVVPADAGDEERAAA